METRLSMYRRDDIIFKGKVSEEHNRTLEKVSQSTKEYGVEFNREKSEFDKIGITFLGHLFASEKLKPDPSKIEAVINCKESKSKEVRRFLGMRRYAILSAPQRDLTRN